MHTLRLSLMLILSALFVLPMGCGKSEGDCKDPGNASLSGPEGGNASLSGPEGKLTILYEKAAGIAEKNKKDCSAMADDITGFAKDNRDQFEETNKALKKLYEEEEEACGNDDLKSKACEDVQRKSWSKGSVELRAHLARSKFRYYTRWCKDSEDMDKAMNEFDKARRRGRD